ncbi:putative DNA repair and recombination protein RAD5B [Cercophora samala]|uniref:DNA repair and recombination protein RAD5B n=1 Tax=Cercophora samala TaxID=330535 RepID=A0AA39Z9F5_9PEZI|nr:putative DNA repair and recombination protein RAD5B [Cercophora samala]
MPPRKRASDDGGLMRPAKALRLTSSQPTATERKAFQDPPQFAEPSQPTAAEREAFQHPPEDAEPIDLTQVDDEPLELYGSLASKIVGVRYYNGVVTIGEVVVSRREPSNQYDENAIRIDNVFGSQVGHVPRTVASKLAPYMDAGDIDIEVVVSGPKEYYECPVQIMIYGTSHPAGRLALEDRLKKDKLLKATQLKTTRKQNELQRQAAENELRRQPTGLKSDRSSVGLPAPAPETTLEDLTKTSQAVNVRPAGGDFVQTLAFGEEQLSQMPLAEQPKSIRAKLLPYQLQGLAWLTAKEKPTFPQPGSPDSVQLWKRDAKGNYNNLGTNITVAKAPALLSGGILADDMGLGKTLQTISLIMTGGPGTTLIVAPVSVMSNWEQQIQRHVHEENAPKVIIHHGPTRQTTAKALNEYGVVITSYGTLASEASCKGPLSQIEWRRVVLDEGHTIRNAKTKASLAACSLKAQSRWVLTGTPIINNIRDLHSLLKFLRITGGLEQAEVFNMVISRPLALKQHRAVSLLQNLMNDLCLRRLKDMKFVDLKLPSKTEYIHRITFWEDEKRKYDALLSEAQGALKDFQSRKKGPGADKNRFQSVLERLLRLRQTCNHWTLCKDRITDLLQLLEDNDVVPLNPKNRALLQQALQLFIESQEECPVCFEVMKSPVITHCKHVYCRPCISKVIEIQGKCPMCRAGLSDDNLVEPAPEKGIEEMEQDSLDRETKSSKTEALLKILQATLKKEGSKVIIFSQWTSFLNIIQRQLDEAGYTYTRIDGSMNATKRDVAIKALDEDPNTKIMLASLAVCSVGLNLVSADTVVLADSWWAPAIEDQAVDRVHRLGQTRETTVWRLVMEGTVEERVLDIQAEKRELVGKAFQEREKKGEKRKETRMADVMKLLS